MLGIAGLVIVIVAPFYVYKNAKQHGHNPVFWTLLAIAVGIGLQLILPLIIGIVMAAVLISQGRSTDEVERSIHSISSIFGIIFLFLSIIGIFLIMRHVNTVRDIKTDYQKPPSPPTFN